jgi:site-specific DNA recombinase
MYRIELDKFTYTRLKEKLTQECAEIRFRITELKKTESGFEEYCRYGISLLSNLPYYYSNATLEGKQKLLGSIFPEKLIFENGNYRTTKPNELLALLCRNDEAFKNHEIKKAAKISGFSCLVPGAGIEPARGLTHWCLRPARLPIPPSGH